MTFKEIAKEMGSSEAAIREVYRRAMIKIQRHPLFPKLQELYAAKEELRSQRDCAAKKQPKGRAE